MNDNEELITMRQKGGDIFLIKSHPNFVSAFIRWKEQGIVYWENDIPIELTSKDSDFFEKLSLILLRQFKHLRIQIQ